MDTMETILDEELVLEKPKNLKLAFKWWESRRGKYNLIVGLVGFLPLLFSGVIFDRDVGYIALIVCLIWAITANLCYFSGWLIEYFIWILFKTRTSFFNQRAIIYKLGLAISVIFTGFCSIAIAISYLDTIKSLD